MPYAPLRRLIYRSGRLDRKSMYARQSSTVASAKSGSDFEQKRNVVGCRCRVIAT